MKILAYLTIMLLCLTMVAAAPTSSTRLTIDEAKILPNTDTTSNVDGDVKLLKADFINTHKANFLTFLPTEIKYTNLQNMIFEEDLSIYAPGELFTQANQIKLESEADFDIYVEEGELQVQTEQGNIVMHSDEGDFRVNLDNGDVLVDVVDIEMEAEDDMYLFGYNELQLQSAFEIYMEANTIQMHPDDVFTMNSGDIVFLGSVNDFNIEVDEGNFVVNTQTGNTHFYADNHHLSAVQDIDFDADELNIDLTDDMLIQADSVDVDSSEFNWDGDGMQFVGENVILSGDNIAVTGESMSLVSDNTNFQTTDILNVSANLMYAFTGNMILHSNNMELKTFNSGDISIEGQGVEITATDVVDIEGAQVKLETENSMIHMGSDSIGVIGGNMEFINSDIILQSPNGNQWRLTVDNNGTLSTQSY